ncbi:unnamed protein product [Closterium sp. NIES-64]|nr:unnamed protein product [Closterium sp. NIES-64]
MSLTYLWAAAVAENDLAFNVSKSKSIQAFVDAVIVYAKPYTLPTPYKVSSPLLEKLKAGSEDLVRPLTDSSKTSGCTLSIDGWTCIESCGLVCVIALNDTAPVIIDIVDSKTAKKTRDCLAGLIEGAIKTVGPKHVVQVVMDNASKNKNAANKLRLEYPHIFFTNCAAHCLDLMLHDIGKIPAIKHVLALVHSVVMMIKGSASAVVLFRELFTKLSLVRLGATRFGTQVIMLGRFLEVKRALRVIVISDRGEGRLGSHNARWAATTLVEAGRMMDAEWWFLFGRDVHAPQGLAVTSLSQPVTSSKVERYWSALARRKAALSSKLYSDLGNGTLREAAINPAEVEEEEGDAEEEGQVEEEEYTIDWSEFGSIGKKRKGKAGESSKGKKKGKGNDGGSGDGRPRGRERGGGAGRGGAGRGRGSGDARRGVGEGGAGGGAGGQRWGEGAGEEVGTGGRRDKGCVREGKRGERKERLEGRRGKQGRRRNWR